MEPFTAHLDTIQKPRYYPETTDGSLAPVLRETELSLQEERRLMKALETQDLMLPESRQPNASGDIWRIAWRRKSLIALGAAVGLVLGALHYSQKIPIYQSSAKLLVVKKRADPSPFLGADPRLSFVGDFVAAHVTLIKSPLLVESAVKSGQLQALPSLSGNPNPVGEILGMLTVNRDATESSGGSSTVLNLACRATEPDDCQMILDAIIDSSE